MQELIEVIKLMNPSHKGMMAAAAAAVGIVCLGATAYEKVVSIKKENEIGRLKVALEKQEFEFKRKLASKDDEFKRKLASKDDVIKSLRAQLMQRQ
jgi:hypothetical protein